MKIAIKGRICIRCLVLFTRQGMRVEIMQKGITEFAQAISRGMFYLRQGKFIGYN